MWEYLMASEAGVRLVWCIVPFTGFVLLPLVGMWIGVGRKMRQEGKR